MESLIKCGAFDRMETPTSPAGSLLADYEAISSSLDAVKQKNLDGQLGFFQPPSPVPPGRNMFFLMWRLSFYGAAADLEKEVTGMYLSGHPLGEYAVRPKVGNGENFPCKAPGRLDDATKICALSTPQCKATRSGDTMAFLTVEAPAGAMEVLVSRIL